VDAKLASLLQAPAKSLMQVPALAMDIRELR
jgi:hypothetical protein